MSSPSGSLPLIPVHPGERLADRYVVERVVGTGGMGVVVAARHEQLGRTVAIKILTISTDLHPEAVERFLREARAAACLRSEHIARVMDAGTDERGRHFIVMEYLEGEDLAAVVRREEGLSVALAVGYLLQVCEALAEAHSQGIIHRDLKPENIFVTRRVDGSPLIKVLDFGISKMTMPPGSLSVSGPRSLLGSPLYMSPEQIRTPWGIDARSDVWALGVILYELLTGRRPFAGPSLPEILAAILTETPPPIGSLRPDLPAGLVLTIESCLEKDVDKRCASVGVLAQCLHEWTPRWARDSSTRAVRMAGLSTHNMGSVDLTGPLFVSSEGTASAPVAASSSRSRRRPLTTALLIAGAAGGLLTLVMWHAHRPSTGPLGGTVSAGFGTARAEPLPAATAAGAPPAPPPVPAAPPANTEAIGNESRTATRTGAEAATDLTSGPPTASPPPSTQVLAVARSRAPAMSPQPQSGGHRSSRAAGVEIAGAKVVPRGANGAGSARSDRLLDERTSSRSRAVPLDPLEGRK